MNKPGRGSKNRSEKLLLSRILQAFREASRTVWNDPAAWIEERDSADARLLVWTRPVEGTGYEQLLAALFNAEVDFILVILEAREHPALPDFPPDINDPKFQVVLRVMHRAYLRGKAAVDAFEDMPGADRVTGMKEFKADYRALAVDLIQRSGLRKEMGDEAFEALGISRAAAYRAMGRRR